MKLLFPPSLSLFEGGEPICFAKKKKRERDRAKKWWKPVPRRKLLKLRCPTVPLVLSLRPQTIIGYFLSFSALLNESKIIEFLIPFLLFILARNFYTAKKTTNFLFFFCLSCYSAATRTSARRAQMLLHWSGVSRMALHCCGCWKYRTTTSNRPVVPLKDDKPPASRIALRP